MLVWSNMEIILELSLLLLLVIVMDKHSKKMVSLISDDLTHSFRLIETLLNNYVKRPFWEVCAFISVTRLSASCYRSFIKR